MDFSVVIPSRNRPALLRRAIDSVLAQTHASVEVIVVNDGSDGEHAQTYATLAGELAGRVRFVNLEHTPKGHGPSYAMNRGAEQAQGEFLCFLDDDDCWTDNAHLTRAKATLGAEMIDAYLSNQAAYMGDTLVQEALWLQGISGRVQAQAAPDAQGAYDVSLDTLMTCGQFPHVNNTILRTSLYRDIGGMDESIRYECEWDLYFRWLERARRIKYFPGIVSRHHVPDQNKAANASTTVSTLQKLLFRSYVMDKALLFTQAAPIAQVARQTKTYTLKKIAQLLAESGQYQRALVYAREAAGGGLNAKWRAYTLYLGLRALAAPRH